MFKTLHYRYRRIPRVSREHTVFIQGSRAFSSSKGSNDINRNSKTRNPIASKTSIDKAAPNGDNKGPVSNRLHRAPILVPKVGSTDHIQQDEVHTDGLFAGHKPLFLGSQSIDARTSRGGLRTIFSTLTKVKKATDGSTSEIDVRGIINDLKSEENTQEVWTNHDGVEKPVIPWDASISGMVYNDRPFKAVPRTVVDRLKPYKLIRVERKSKTAKPRAPELIKLKFHNSKINDETFLIDINQAGSRRTPKPQWSESMAKSREAYVQALTLLSQFKFIRSDQHVFKTDVNRLSMFLAKEFQKTTKLTVDTEFTGYRLPFYIYIEKTISSKILFRRLLLKRINDHTEPLLKTILSSYSNPEHGPKFEKRVRLKVKSLIEDLSEYLPSIFFSGNAVDCVSNVSPVKGFGRLHWLTYSKRRRVFWGRNIDNDFTFNIDEHYKMSRSGVRYMKHPLSLQCKTFREAFTEWEYYP
ncbi:LAME_0F19438g1_1 [Lachancea meyersii CBS 8951]|uniref:LAME_0F19438g1_1 n=1 Tax=Lachancea meyersii CBS 8951 TaxID=1266667 RepID=A0A1G4K1F4_9SACH|nr:LAME_0F19438g1_1 [Lachancea meyersii CBS 8951]